MAATVGSLNVNATLQTAQFDKNVEKMKGKLKGLQGSFASVGAKMTSIGKKMTIGITAPLVAFGAMSFKVASDAAELDAAFGETFGNMTKDLDAWAEATGDAMGRSTREIKEGMNTFGLYFNQVAKTREEAAEMSKTFTVLAQDLASFHNTDVATALQSLRSGLSGEAEPMRKFGVFLNDAAVSAKAAEMGIASLGTKLTDQQKIAARYAIIMEKTAVAHGDVLRTSDSAANQVRASAAAWEELQEAIGEKLIPAITPLVGTLTNLLEKFNKLSPSTQSWVIGIAAIGAALGPVMMVLGPLIKGFGALLPLIVKLGPAFVALRVAALALLANPVILGAAALIGGIYLAWKNWDEITAIVQRVVQGVKTWIGDALGRILDSAKRKVESFAQPFVWLYNKLVGNSVVPELIDGIAAQMRRLDAVMVAPAVAATTKTAQAFQALQASVHALLDRLFPEQARGNQFLRELQELRDWAAQGKLSVDELTEAMRRLRNLHFGETGEPSIMSEEISVAPAFPDAEKALTPWLQQIPDLTQKTNQWAEAMRNVAFAAGDSLASGLTAVIMGAAKLGEVFSSVAKQIIADIIQMTLRMAIFRAIAGMFGGGAGINVTSSGGGGAFALPGFAQGGSFKIGGMAGIDRNLLSLNGSPIARVSRNEMIDVIPANDRGGGTAHVIVELNDPLLKAKIVSGAVEVVGQAAPQIVRTAANATMRAATRPKLMGGR